MKVLTAFMVTVLTSAFADERIDVPDDANIYDVAIVGGGLFGSATAKYVSEDTKNAILIGPSEAAKTEIDIFGAWFDEGRIAELADSDGVWYKVANHSIGRFRDIEKDSGVKFFTENGFMNMASKKDIDDDELELYEKLCDDINSDGHQCVKVTSGYAKEKFPYLNLPQDFAAFHQPNYAGVINPRKLVEAQLKLAKRNGMEIADAHVTKVQRLTQSPGFAITASNSDGSGERKVYAYKLIVAAGAYTNLNTWLQDLLPADKKDQKPNLVLGGVSVAFLELSPEEAGRLKDFPNIVTHYQYGALDGTYILPPIKYPDGKIYLKLGHSDAFEFDIPDATGLTEVTEWYQEGKGDPEAVKVLADFIQKSFIPDIKVLSVHGSGCVITKTPGYLNPYIGFFADNVILVTGGNGYGANGSDEIGRIGAKLATQNEWTSEIPQESLAVQWKKR